MRLLKIIKNKNNISWVFKKLVEKKRRFMFCLKRVTYITLLVIACYCKVQSINRPLKILIFETYFPPKTSTAVLNQITGLLDRGHEVYIYAREPGDMQQAHPDVEKYGLMKKVYFSKNKNNRRNTTGKINKTGRYRLQHYLSNKRMGVKRHLRNLPSDLHTYDIIYCPFGYRGIEFLDVFKKRRLKAKFVIGFRGADLSRDIQNDSHKYDALFKQCDLLLPVCDYFKRKLIKLGCPEEKIIVVHSAIDCNLFFFSKRKFSRKKTIRIISICRFVEKKGLEYGIKAVAALLKKHENIEYRIVGSGPLKDNLLNLVQELGVQDKVKISGQVSQNKVASLLKNAHIFLLPSITARDGDEEGIPNSVKEAMAMGLIPISTCHAGISELVKNNSGFLVSPKDVPALVEKINYLIKHPGVWQKMSLAGRKIIEKEYEKEHINNQLEQIFQRLVE